MCSKSMASAHVILKTKIKGGCQSERKVLPHNSKSDLPLISENITGLSSRSAIFKWLACLTPFLRVTLLMMNELN